MFVKKKNSWRDIHTVGAFQADGNNTGKHQDGSVLRIFKKPYKSKDGWNRVRMTEARDKVRGTNRDQIIQDLHRPW